MKFSLDKESVNRYAAAAFASLSSNQGSSSRQARSGGHDPRSTGRGLKADRSSPQSSAPACEHRQSTLNGGFGQSMSASVWLEYFVEPETIRRYGAFNECFSLCKNFFLDSIPTSRYVSDNRG